VPASTRDIDTPVAFLSLATNAMDEFDEDGTPSPDALLSLTNAFVTSTNILATPKSEENAEENVQLNGITKLVCRHCRLWMHL
jgi:hypothetical protein